jgi:hypothetical protein
VRRAQRELSLVRQGACRHVLQQPVKVVEFETAGPAEEFQLEVVGERIVVKWRWPVQPFRRAPEDDPASRLGSAKFVFQ